MGIICAFYFYISLYSVDAPGFMIRLVNFFLFWKKDRGLVDGCRSWRRSKPQLLLSQVQIKLRLFKGAASPGDEELCWSSGQKTGKAVKAERLMVMVSFYRIYFIFLSLHCSSCGHNEFFPRPCLQSVDI